MNDGVDDGASYLQNWHDRHAGATTAVLSPITDELSRNTYQMLAEALQSGDGPVLDLACGDGHLLELLRERRACIGVDLNPAELRVASRRLEKRIPLVRADAASLPISAAALGAVGCHDALMLLQPLERVLEELSRVLRRDGLFVTVLPASPTEKIAGPISVFRGVWQDSGCLARGDDNLPSRDPAGAGRSSSRYRLFGRRSRQRRIHRRRGAFGLDIEGDDDR